MSLEIYTFLTILLLTLGLVLFLSGIFAAYIGRLRSKETGITLAILGFLIWVVSYAVHRFQIFGEDAFAEVIKHGLFSVGAFLLGLAIAIAILFITILKI
ncbi:MAG: hypothetical protein ACLFSM_07495 [Thermoplasmata archaeon]